MNSYRVIMRAVCVLTTVGFAASAAMGQPTFSIDHQGPTPGVPDSFTATPISEGDVLSSPFPGPPLGVPAPGPLPPPGTVIPVGALGVVPGAAGFAEVDALSYGRDANDGQWFFSVDEFAVGLPGVAIPPNVTTEGAAGAMEASADIYTDVGLPLGPLPPLGIGGNTGFLDGDGMFPFGAPGYGLIEPNPPTPGVFPDPGDNLDAVDIDTTVGDLGGPVYFSLDSFLLDPIEGAGANTGTAMANGFVGGDVLVSFGGVPALYAPAPALGLDLMGIIDADDLDALALNDNGDGIYTPGLDTIFFSVRRGSLVIGMVDSIWGVPIEEGDILVPPVAGGLSPFPGIWVPGEALGLATMRVIGAGQRGDELNALDIVPEPGTIGLLLVGGLMLMRRRRLIG